MGLRRKAMGSERVVCRVEANGASYRACDRWVSLTTADPGRSTDGWLRVFCGPQHVGWMIPADAGWFWQTSGWPNPRRSACAYRTAEVALRRLATTAWAKRIGQRCSV